MIEPARVLLTGAAGIVGALIRPLLAQRYQHVLLTDLVELTDLKPNEEFEQGDISDFEFVRGLSERVDAVIHLAGVVGASYQFEEVLGPNIVGTHHVFTAARDAGISNVVYASSHHAVGFLRRGELIDETTAHRPNSEYGLSKAFGESAASYFADKFGMNILSIRIGYVGTVVENERRLHTWISPRDLVQLIEIGLGTPGLGHEIVYGISETPDPFFDNRNAERLGYQPRDRAIDEVTDPSVLQESPDLSTIAGGVVGGGFAAEGFAGDAKRILESS